MYVHIDISQRIYESIQSELPDIGLVLECFFRKSTENLWRNEKIDNIGLQRTSAHSLTPEGWQSHLPGWREWEMWLFPFPAAGHGGSGPQAGKATAAFPQGKLPASVRTKSYFILQMHILSHLVYTWLCSRGSQGWGQWEGSGPSEEQICRTLRLGVDEEPSVAWPEPVMGFPALSQNRRTQETECEVWKVLSFSRINKKERPNLYGILRKKW